MEILDWNTFYFMQFSRQSWLTPLLSDVHILGSYAFLAAVVLAALIWLLLRRRYHPAVFFLGVVLAGVVVAEGLKLVIGRARPPDWLGGFEGASSFPSGEDLLATVIYVTLALLLPPPGLGLRPVALGVALFLVLLIGASHLYLGFHFLSDVLAGWLGGALLILVGSRFAPAEIALQ